jgi:acetyl-CoA C-acetyltransferase
MHTVAVGGGVESMSRVGMFSDGGALHADPEVRVRSGYVDIGPAADAMASAGGFTRQQLDHLAVESNLRAAARNAQGPRPSLVAVHDEAGEVLLDHDEGVRPNATLEAFGALPPLFAEVDPAQLDLIRDRIGLDGLQALHTIATAPKMCDAASAVLLAAPGALDSAPRARVVAATNVALRSPGLTGGTVAVQQALVQAGMTLDDVDLFEINESFAATPLHFMTTTGVEHERVNVTGGAMAMGHPLGATGGILLATLLDELEARDLQVGALAIPAAGGLGAALVIERV